MVDDTSRLLGLHGLAVVGVADGPDGPLVQLETADERARVCPECGTRARRSKGRRTTHPRDLLVGGRRPQLVWSKRRWRCDQPACPRKSFTEAVPAVLAAQAVGGIAGAWWASRKADRLTPLRLLGGAALASGFLLVVIINYALIYPTWWPAVALTGVAGFPFAVFGAAQGYALQIYAPPHLRGRVYSLAVGILSLTQASGIMITGIAAQR